MNTVLEIFNAIPAEVWESLVAAFFLSPVMLGIKKWMKVHREAVMLFYVIGGAMVTAAVAYVKDTPDAAPWAAIPIQTAYTFALSQPVYYLIYKPLRNQFRQAMKEATEINDAKRAAALDGTSTLLQPAAGTTTDFK